jgi:hypothetical protein
MANSKLEDKRWDIPAKMTKHLNKIFNAYKGPKDVEGYERLRDLLSSDTITYQQMKRIKNFFDNFKGKNNETPYILNGGTKVKNWVNSRLKDARDGIENKKKSMKDIGMDNQYQKDQSTRVTKPTVDTHKSELKKTMGESEINKVKNLITIIENNKRLWHTEEHL